MGDSFSQRFSRLGKPVVIAISLSWMAATGWFDYRAGLELSLFALYWPAVCLATWYCGAPWGYGLGVISVAVAAVDDIIAGRAHPHLAAAVIETVTRLISFCFFVWGLARLREAYALEGRTRRVSEEAAELKTGLMSLMSHEINNAIAVMKMTLFLMQENEPDPPAKRRDAYDIFGRVLLNMELAARNFLNNARVEGGKLSLTLEPVDSVARIEDTVGMFAPLLQQRHQTLVVDAAKGLPKVRADRAALMLILSNLIGNAVKYTQDGGRIVVKVELSELQRASAKISISDTGIGINPKDREKIMEGFVRLPEGKVMAKGFGLGLKTVHDLLQLHGSHLEIDGQTGKGSTFSFILPLAGA
jgi:signal transduction histidine kinase